MPPDSVPRDPETSDPETSDPETSEASGPHPVDRRPSEEELDLIESLAPEAEPGDRPAAREQAGDAPA